MDIFISVWDFFKSDAGTGIVVGLLAISEALASIPAIKANSVFQLVTAVLKRIMGRG